MANLIANRTAALVYVSILLDQVPLIEQPDHKRGLIALPRWQQLLADFQFFKVRCCQGAYMALTEKPTALISVHKHWGYMCNVLDAADRERIANHGKELVSKKRDSQGNLRITGKPADLKSTQSYTPEFGRAIVEKWLQGCDSCLM